MMKIKARDLLTLLTGLVLGVSLVIQHTVFAQKDEVELPVNGIRALSEVYNEIIKLYVDEEVDRDELLNNAIQGMVNSLDPHSSYLLPDEHKEMKINTSGKFGGLGIEVGMEDGFVKVIAPIDDTPAERAGIEAGDLIVRIDDDSVQGMTLQEAVDKMRGTIGTKVNLSVMREGESQALPFTITRAEISMRSVKSKMLEDGFGYVRISQFQVHTSTSLEKHLKKLVKEKNNGRKLKGLVLDLRNNPGGALNAAVEVSDVFLDNAQQIVSIKGRLADSKSEYIADRRDYLHGSPLVVLVNHGSASGSEIVAGALQDHKRALILGTKTFGKGSVQTILPMRDGAGLKLTTARYFTPNGRSIQTEGVKPDIEIKPLKIEKNEKEHDIPKRKRFSEKNLSGHLENEDGKQDTDKKEQNKTEKNSVATSKDKKEQEQQENLAETDFVLFEALNVLKGMALVQHYKTL